MVLSYNVLKQDKALAFPTQLPLKKKGAEVIVLGYTELPPLNRPSDVHVPLFGITRLHAEAAVKLALAE